MSVNGWMNMGGSNLGTNRTVPTAAISMPLLATLRNTQSMACSSSGLERISGSIELYKRRDVFPAFNIPIVLMPATIDNDLPVVN